MRGLKNAMDEGVSTKDAIMELIMRQELQEEWARQQSLHAVVRFLTIRNIRRIVLILM